MGFYEQRILPVLCDRSLGGEVMDQQRRETLAGVSGHVLEVGLGSALNLSCYPAGVERLTAVEPSRGMLRRAEQRIAAASFPVEIVTPTAEGGYPLEDGSVDAVVTTLTLCTLPDPAAALGEFRRVMGPAGAYFFLEHGAGESLGVRWFQDWLTPVQKRIGGGCHLNRPIEEIVRRAGFTEIELERYVLPKTPRIWGSMYRGRAAG